MIKKEILKLVESKNVDEKKEVLREIKHNLSTIFGIDADITHLILLLEKEIKIFEENGTSTFKHDLGILITALNSIRPQ